MKIEKLFSENAKKHGTVIYGNVEIALLENPFPEHTFYGWYYRLRASGLDKAGNLWHLCWDVIPSVDSNADYAEWDSPAYANLTVKGYFLDD